MNDTAIEELGRLFSDHLRTVGQRFERALASCGYDSALLFSGTAPMLFRDDNSYPFRVHATFKAWAPLTDVPESFVFVRPGETPVLLLHQPADYWYKPAATPRG